MIKPIPGWDGLYSAGDDGKIYSHRVFTHPNEKMITRKIDPNLFTEIPQTLKRRGYYTVLFYPKKGKRKFFYVHRALALAFIPNPQYLPEINHINGIKTDNRLVNMEWCTRRYNVNHAVKLGLIKCHGEENPSSKLSNVQRRFITRVYLAKEMSALELAAKFNVNRTTITRVARQWKNK